MTTTAMLRVTVETRNEVLRLGADELNGATADEVVRWLLDVYRRHKWAKAANEYFADPANREAYLSETRDLDGLDAEPGDRWHA